MVAHRCLDKDAECLAARRWVLSEFEEETLSSLIQTGESFSSNLKTAIIEEQKALQDVPYVWKLFI